MSDTFAAPTNYFQERAGHMQSRRRWSQRKYLIVFATTIFVVSVAMPALGGPKALSAASALSTAKKALKLAKKADKKATQALNEGGPRGPQGTIGPVGAAGQVGPQGTIGLVGAAGQVGPQGVKGDTGQSGARGETGVTGPTGETGSPGAPGPNGVVTVVEAKSGVLAVDANSSNSGTATCPVGMKRTGGGVLTSSATVRVSETHGGGSDRMWTARVTNSSGVEHAFIVVAYCVTSG